MFTTCLGRVSRAAIKETRGWVCRAESKVRDATVKKKKKKKKKEKIGVGALEILQSNAHGEERVTLRGTFQFWVASQA